AALARPVAARGGRQRAAGRRCRGLPRDHLAGAVLRELREAGAVELPAHGEADVDRALWLPDHVGPCSAPSDHGERAALRLGPEDHRPDAVYRAAVKNAKPLAARGVAEP